MAATTLTQTHKQNTTNVNKSPKYSKLACFSFAAYAKALIGHLESCNIPFFPGLSDAEFNSVESNFGFVFPPDLRSILQEGLPVAPGFPNWRSSSPQQLHILLKLPTLGLLKQVSQRRLWCESWGVDQPGDTKEALALAKKFLDKAPVLVPLYRHFYIPSNPNMAGNPVFYVNGGDVRVFSFDIAGFFQKVEFLQFSRGSGIKAPPWAATAARRIEFWTDMAERGGTRWWSTGDLARCLDEVFWKLRDAGWKEEEVKEMMMMDGGDARNGDARGILRTDKEGLVWYMRVLSTFLLHAGWSREDVVYSLGLQEHENRLLEGKSILEITHNVCSKVDDEHGKKLSLKELMQLQPDL